MQKKRLKLQGFNNLTKTLSFNIYDINFATSEHQQGDYIAYIDETYDAERLTQILTEVANIIGASILNIAHQDYDPQGASVTMLISEEPTTSEALVSAAGQDEMPGPLRAPHRPPLHEAVVAHLDKSHITVHTYPESHPDNGISTFRADIDVSTCGRISPLRALNYLIHSFDSDIVIMDYRIRGFTRDIKGVKHFVDHDLTSIQNFLSDDTRERYDRVDVNVYQENLFHTRMRVKDFVLDNYLFGMSANDLGPREAGMVRERLQHEMDEIFYGRNMKKGKLSK
ncbi:MAG: adenosylmethionine decarboxylase [Deltaproteobacteria bacterium]|nr:adenosylmethionine decarboxylase [Deltaproteobacteria bacterium]